MQKEFPNLTSLEILVATLFYEERHTELVVEKLDMPRSTVLAIIRRIHTKLGVCIFEISKNGTVTVLPKGCALLPAFSHVTSILNKVYAHTNALYYTPYSRHFKLSAPETLLEAFFLPEVRQLLYEQPQVSLSLSQVDCHQQVEQRFEEIRLTSWIDSDAEGQYTFIPFYTFKQKLWASQEYIQSRGPFNNTEDLAGHRFLVYRDNSSHYLQFDAKFSQSYYLLKKIPAVEFLFVSGLRSLDLLVADGVGITMALEERVKISHPNWHQVVPSFSGEPLTFYLRIATSFLESPTSSFFLDWLFSCRDKTLKKIGIAPPTRNKQKPHVA